MYTFAGLAIWGLGMYFTFDALADMGVQQPFVAAFVLQCVLSFGESLLMSERYKYLPQSQQKVICVVAYVFIAFDTWLNYRGIYPAIGDVHSIMPDGVKDQIAANVFNVAIALFLAFAVATSSEILLLLNKGDRRHNG